MSGQKQTFAPQVRSFDLSRSSINEDARTVDLVFSTDTDQVERWFGREILDIRRSRFAWRDFKMPRHC